MDSSKKCNNMLECCRMHRCSAVGVVLILIATILTIVTFSGLGILGMFLVGLAMCCHKRLLCQSKYCNEEGVEGSCDVVVVKEAKKPAKKP